MPGSLEVEAPILGTSLKVYTTSQGSRSLGKMRTLETHSWCKSNLEERDSLQTGSQVTALGRLQELTNANSMSCGLGGLLGMTVGCVYLDTKRSFKFACLQRRACRGLSRTSYDACCMHNINQGLFLMCIILQSYGEIWVISICLCVFYMEII